MHIKESIYINATPESLFPYVIDPEKSEEWDENRQSMEILTEGPFGKGTRVLSLIHISEPTRPY